MKTKTFWPCLKETLGHQGNRAINSPNLPKAKKGFWAIGLEVLSAKTRNVCSKPRR